jgi:Fe2+ or Zn2+ uptake regulation protein
MEAVKRENEMEEALRASGWRITRQRRAILKYLSATDVHPSAARVFEEAKKHCPHLSLATVYNTLEALVERGMIKVIEFQAKDNRHETNLRPHINLVCTLCGRIQDFECDLAIQADLVREEFGFQIQDYRMEYHGICEACRTSGPLS